MLQHSDRSISETLKGVAERKEDSTITVRKPCKAGILRVEIRESFVEIRESFVEIRESFEETREGFAETKVDVAETRVGVAETRVGVAETRVSVAETGESLKIKRNTAKEDKKRYERTIFS